jgi:cysteine desulfurase family protein
MRSLGSAAYLDYAATSAVRPPAVAEAVADYLREVGGTPGRGGHRVGIAAGRVALGCRRLLAELLNLPGDPGRLAFTLNATYALNAALGGVLRPGQAVVVTALDHNAVLRPARALARERGVELRLVPVDATGALDEDAFARALGGARLLVINGASNVLGTAADVAALTARAHDAGALVLLDAAQTAGHMPVDVAAAGVDMVALTGHKGLLGPQGVGGLWVREGVDVSPTLRGGTGGDSRREEMPEALPDRLEAGTQNAPGMAGLAAGVRFILERGVDALRTHAMDLKARLRSGLEAVEGVTVLSPPAPDGVPIVTVRVDAVEPAAAAARLDREFGVLVRPGLHCAPEAHRVLGTVDTGALRLSLGWASTAAEVDRAVAALAAVAAPAGARR